MKSYDHETLMAMSVEQLEAEVRHHNRRYWDQDQPEISDYDYDRLVERLRELAPASAALSDFGAERFGEPVAHERPMLSLDKCYSDEDLASWATKFEGQAVVTPKLDGIAASLRFDDKGELAVAATRGNGTVGDDITVNARTIADIPARLAATNVEVRGEIYMRLSVFEGYRDQFSNPRNLTAGAVKHKDPERCRAYGLSFAAFDLLGAELASERAKLERLAEIGFPPVEFEIASGEGLGRAYTRFAARRDQLDYEIDGVVFKADRVDEQLRLGSTAHHPRYAIAYKFQGESDTTVLEDVIWSVARTGTITPVARIRPVTLSGASVSRASLHNAGFVEKKDLTLGAEVLVTRRGGVIPNVERVVTPGDGEIALPERCPSCDGPLSQEGDFLYCAAPEQCPEALIGTIAHYCKVVDIQGFGDKLLRAAFDAGLLRDPADLYTLGKQQLLGLDRVGDKLADKLVAQVDGQRRIELAVFLRALGIDELGKHVSTILRDRYGTLEAVRAVAADELAAIHTIGEIIAHKVVEGLAARAPLIGRLLEQVELHSEETGATSGPLTGKSVVFTGKLLTLDRKSAQNDVRELGGDAPSSVGKTLGYLVIGDGKTGSKSSKQLKAEKLIAAGASIEIISESEFLALIGRVGEGIDGR